MQNYGAKNGKIRIQTLKNEAPGLMDFFESVFYELKPFIYCAIAFWALHASVVHAAWFKLGFMIILLYSVLISFSRLSYRGYIDDRK